MPLPQSCADIACALVFHDDSANLVDLRAIFDEGLHKADAVVLLCTPNVLSRPWCLLELWEATQRDIPVLLVRIPLPGQSNFDVNKATTFVQTLDTSLELATPGALETVKQHLEQQGATINDLQCALLAILASTNRRTTYRSSDRNTELGSGRELNSNGARILNWDPCSSDRLMVAATQELSERLGRLCGQSLVWKEADTPAPGESTPFPAKCPCIHAGVGRPMYGFFISYYRAETGPDARLLQVAIEHELGEAVFLDATDLDDLHGILNALERSRALLLLLSAHVLERPWVLIEVYTAIRLKLPIVCVNIQGTVESYDFGQAADYLCNLEQELGKRDPGALAELQTQLEAHGLQLPRLQVSSPEPQLVSTDCRSVPDCSSPQARKPTSSPRLLKPVSPSPICYADPLGRARAVRHCRSI